MRSTHLPTSRVLKYRQFLQYSTEVSLRHTRQIPLQRLLVHTRAATVRLAVSHFTSNFTLCKEKIQNRRPTAQPICLLNSHGRWLLRLPGGRNNSHKFKTDLCAFHTNVLGGRNCLLKARLFYTGRTYLFTNNIFQFLHSTRLIANLPIVHRMAERL